LLAIVAAVNAVLGVAVYLRWLLTVVSTPDASAHPAPLGAPDGAGPVAVVAVRVHPATLVAVGLSAVALVLTSLNPQLLLGLLGR
jgi:NADH-quinone oxidoreductase subunit N